MVKGSSNILSKTMVCSKCESELAYRVEFLTYAKTLYGSSIEPHAVRYCIEPCETCAANKRRRKNKS